MSYYERIIYALYYGILEVHEKMIDCYGGKDSSEHSKDTDLLGLALESGHIAPAKLLLSKDYECVRKRDFLDKNLHLAVEFGDAEIVQMILARGANVEVKNDKGKTPLHVAIKMKKFDIIELLIEETVDVNIKLNERGKSLLHLAIENECVDAVRHLLNKGALLDYAYTAKHSRVSTPLQLAVVICNEKIVSLLLHGNANVDARGTKDATPLHFAAEFGEKNIVAMLLNKNAKVDPKNKNGVTPLHMAAEKGFVTIIKDLLSHGASAQSLTLDGYTPLHFACRSNSLRAVKTLLARGAQISDTFADKYTPLHIATRHGSKELVNFFLKNNIDVDSEDSKGRTVLHSAVETAKPEIVKMVLKYHPDIDNSSNKTSLKIAVENSIYFKEREVLTAQVNHYAIRLKLRARACSKITLALVNYGLNIRPEDANNGELFYASVRGGFAEVVESLLKFGVDVNLKNLEWVEGSPLHCAVRHNQKIVAKLLINHKADVNVKDREDHPPLYYSIKNGSCKITKLLLDGQATLNDMSENGMTGLHVAAAGGHTRVVNLLLKYGAEVDFMTEEGFTPLHLAARKGNKSVCFSTFSYVKIVDALLIFNADPDIQDNYGRTALHFAAENANYRIINLLLDHGADINFKCKSGKLPYVLKKGRLCCGSFAEMMNAFQQKVILLQTANLFVSEQHYLKPGDIKITNFRNECQKEMEILKSDKIDNTNISVYDILVKDVNTLAVYVGNTNVVQVLRSADYKTKFPIYAHMIKSNFRKGMKRREVLERCKNVWQALFHQLPDLPEECIEKISCFLGNEDLRILMDACTDSIVNNHCTTEKISIATNIAQLCLE